MKLKLMDGVAMHAAYPDTFEIPSDERKMQVQPGWFCKIGVKLPDGNTERIWTEVTDAEDGLFLGKLANDPVLFEMEYGDPVNFAADNILSIMSPDEEAQHDKEYK